MLVRLNQSKSQTDLSLKPEWRHIFSPSRGAASTARPKPDGADGSDDTRPDHPSRDTVGSAVPAPVHAPWPGPGSHWPYPSTSASRSELRGRRFPAVLSTRFPWLCRCDVTSSCMYGHPRSFHPPAMIDVIGIRCTAFPFPETHCKLRRLRFTYDDVLEFSNPGLGLDKTLGIICVGWFEMHEQNNNGIQSHLQHKKQESWILMKELMLLISLPEAFIFERSSIADIH